MRLEFRPYRTSRFFVVEETNRIAAIASCAKRGWHENLANQSQTGLMPAREVILRNAFTFVRERFERPALRTSTL